MSARNQGKGQSSSLLTMLKRKFLILLCFMAASSIILHLLTNNHDITRTQLHKRVTVAITQDIPHGDEISKQVGYEVQKRTSRETRKKSSYRKAKPTKDDQDILTTKINFDIRKDMEESPTTANTRDALLDAETDIFQEEILPRKSIEGFTSQGDIKQLNNDNGRGDQDEDPGQPKPTTRVERKKELRTSLKKSHSDTPLSTFTHTKNTKREEPLNVSPIRKKDEATDTTSSNLVEVIIKDRKKVKTYSRRSVKELRTTSCSYEGLSRPEETFIAYENMTCVPHKRTEKDCREAFSYFGEYNIYSKPPKCNERGSHRICEIHTKYRHSTSDEVRVQCDVDSCRDQQVLLGCRDKRYGSIPDEKFWQKFNSVNDLEFELPALIKKNSLLGFSFCFLKCLKDENEQALIFPQILKRAKRSGGLNINVNILIEDAVSRPHFYRSLPHTVKVLRQLARNRNSSATVLDFELVQSYASFTLTHLRMLFAGTKLLKADLGTNNRNSGISDLMKRFKKRGYQTLLQEDLCFFDFWGTALSTSYKKKVETFTKKFKAVWKNYIQSTKGFIDNRGLSQFACEGLQSLGHTNPFKNLPQICFDGKFMSEYLLKYVEKFLEGTESVQSTAPAFVYTHLNTAHESTGNRIRTDDIPLANFVDSMSKLKNTITIILSDHGSKTTDYSISTFQGRLEVFSPVMFMVIPDKVAKKLGKKQMKALMLNQNKLVALIDLHGMLKSFTETSLHAYNYRTNGLLAPIPHNRTCADLEGLSSDAYCRCRGWNHFISAKSQQVHWLAEVALGEINNMISQQYRKGRKTKTSSNLLGFGECARFLGKAVERPRQKMAGKFFITTFVLVVEPSYGATSVERFEVQLNHSSVGHPNITLLKVTRLSIYGKYDACVDKNVDIKLCACALDEDDDITPKPGLKELMAKGHFGIKTSIRFLNSRCLLFGVRKFKTKVINKLQSRVLAFEIANRCRRTSFLVKLGGTSRKSVISRKLPFAFRVQPRTISFLYAVNNAWKYGSFRPLVMLTRE